MSGKLVECGPWKRSLYVRMEITMTRKLGRTKGWEAMVNETEEWNALNLTSRNLLKKGNSRM